MSSITQTSDARRAPQLRLTRRGRMVIFMVLVCSVALLMIMLSGLADAGAPQQVHWIQVAPGQTLTDIAQTVGRQGDIRDTIVEIEQLNNMSGAALQAGQRLAVPVR